MTRLRRWLRYQRHLGRLISEHLDAGYRISAGTEQRYREQARAAAGYDSQEDAWR
jgi:hypothetical protein